MRYKIILISTLLSVLIVSGCATRRPAGPVDITPSSLAKTVAPVSAAADEKIKTEAPASVKVEDLKSQADQPPKNAQKKFRVGEHYGFRLDWIGIPVGYVSFDISGIEKIGGREVYVVTLKARTNKFASAIYKIDDVYTSYVDTEQLIPLRYDVDRKEGLYRKKATTIFDHDKKTAYFENFKDGSKKSYPIPPGILDPVSSVLKARTLDIDVGKYHVLIVNNNEEIYTIHAKIEKRATIVIHDFGKFQAFFVTPFAVTKGVRDRRGTVSGYISADDNRMILYGEAEAPLFTKITATLIEMR